MDSKESKFFKRRPGKNAWLSTLRTRAIYPTICLTLLLTLMQMSLFWFYRMGKVSTSTVKSDRMIGNSEGIRPANARPGPSSWVSECMQGNRGVLNKQSEYTQVLDHELSMAVESIGLKDEIALLFSSLDQFTCTTNPDGIDVVFIVATTETEYLAYNLVVSAHKTGMQKIFVVFVGRMIPDFCHAQPRLLCFLIAKDIPSLNAATNRRHIKDVTYKALMLIRQLSVWFLLQKGVHVLILDTDVYLQKNVLVHLSSLQHFDFAAQGIDCRRKSWYCFGLNGGLFYARASNVTVQLFHRSITEYKGNVSHQEALNKAASITVNETNLKIWRLEYDLYPYLEDIVLSHRGTINHQRIIAIHLTGHLSPLGKHLESIGDKFSLMRRHGFLEESVLMYYSAHEFGFHYPLPERSKDDVLDSRSNILLDDLSACSLLFASFFITGNADGQDEAITRLMVALKSAKLHHPLACLGIVTKKSTILNQSIEPGIFLFEVLPADQEEMGREFYKSLFMPRYRAFALLLGYLPSWLNIVFMDGDMLVTGSVEDVFSQNFHVGLTLMRIPSVKWVERHYLNERQERRTGEIFSGGMFFISSHGRKQAQTFFHELVLSAHELSMGEAQHLPDQAVIYHLFRQQGKITHLLEAIAKNQSHACSQLLLQGMVVHFAILGWEFNAPFGLHCPDDRVLHFKGLNSNWPQSKENPKKTMLLVKNDSHVRSQGYCKRTGFVVLDGKQEVRIFSKVEANTQVLCTTTTALGHLNGIGFSNQRLSTGAMPDLVRSR